MNKKYQLRYLPLFRQDMAQTVSYIANGLKNTEAALKLIDDVEAAILERLDHPVSFEPYYSAKKRKHPYYRIYVRNYVIYYVVVDDVMEVRRFLYGARDVEKYL
ncbi:MAG TPA: type II toxin-antitoxin system RelE/ParE family toxin [Candidatus Limivivens merdigallinarum]|uniref:Type II toxin-antitoxin system RelE/ParE family toxin n=1 Tax=Candidatus Limivivens merdigallinarum TaxID=2840859 RepID=A0A9D0ZTR2_9FIRM|nr:type II toxin-antitoxin system RelE/ParE family toxin [Candidatus Limivivens merdigallinarum]